MATYFFHLRDSDELLIDPDGREVNLHGVALNALEEARALIAADALAGHIRLCQQIEVCDGVGNMVHRLEFTDAVQISLPPTTR